MIIIKKTGLISIIASLLAVCILSVVMPRAEGGSLSKPFPAAEFTQSSPAEWINSEPLTLGDITGKVTLIDFWTFDCWNCYRSFPWLTEMESRLSGVDFQIIGVHTPEFEHEKIRNNIVEKTIEFNLHHPVMIDNDFSYWNAMKNRYWPAFYLLDRKGQVRAVFFGETHAGDEQANRIEQIILQLLNE